MSLPPDADLTQPAPPPPPPAAPSGPPPSPPAPAVGPPGGGGLSTAGLVGLLLIVVSVVAIGGAFALLGTRGNPSTSPVAVIPTRGTPTPAPGDPTATPTADPASPSPASSPSPTPPASADPKPGGIATPAPTGTPSSVVKLPRLGADIAGATRIRYYAITGDVPIELIRQMERKGSIRCEDDALACVRLSVTPRVTYRVNLATGACTITGARPLLTANVELPRWTKPVRVDRAVLAWWREVFDHIAWHEGRHIKIEQAWMRKLGGMLEGKPCARAAAIVGRWAKRVAAAQDSFDARDRATWTYPPFPRSG